MNKIREAKLSKAAQLENAALPAIAWMESRGVDFDVDAWEYLRQGAEAEVERLRERLEEFAVTVQT